MNTESLIISRLGERDRKLVRLNEFMKGGEHDSGARSRKGYVWFSTAACVLALFFVGLHTMRHNDFDGLVITPPEMMEFRGGGNLQIEERLSNRDFSSGLHLTEASIAEVENELKLHEALDRSDPAVEYMINMEKEYLESLLWTKIYILIQLKDKEAVIKACGVYLEDADNQIYRAEVERVLDFLR